MRNKKDARLHYASNKHTGGSVGAVDSGVWRAGGPPWRTQRPTRVESHNLSERPNRQPTHSTLVHLDTRVCSYCTSVRLHPGSTRIPVTLDRHVDRMPRTGPRWLTLSARVHLHPTPLYFTSWPVESVTCLSGFIRRRPEHLCALRPRITQAARRGAWESDNTSPRAER